MLPLVSTYRYEGDEVNMHLAKSEAKILHQKISDKAYSDDDLIRILATRSKAQIHATLNQYKNDCGNDINKVCIFVLYYRGVLVCPSFFLPLAPHIFANPELSKAIFLQ